MQQNKIKQQMDITEINRMNYKIEINGYKLKYNNMNK